jgi:fucose permease
VEWCVKYWGTDFLAQAVGMDAAGAATAMGAFFGALLLGRVVAGRLVRLVGGGGLLLGSLIVILAAFPVLWLSPSLPSPVPWAVAGLFVVGLGVSNLYPLATAIATRVVRHRADEAAARLFVVVGAAGLAAPYALGWAAEGLGLVAAFGAVAPLALSALAVAYLALRKDRASKTAAECAGSRREGTRWKER